VLSGRWRIDGRQRREEGQRLADPGCLLERERRRGQCWLAPSAADQQGAQRQDAPRVAGHLALSIALLAVVARRTPIRLPRGVFGSSASR